MSEHAVKAVHKAAVVLVGFGGAAGAGFLGLMLAYGFGYTCGGGEGSGGVGSDAWICQGQRETTVIWGGWAISMGAPLLGMIWALNAERWSPLWVGLAVAVLDLIVLYWLVWNV